MTPHVGTSFVLLREMFMGQRLKASLTNDKSNRPGILSSI